MPILGLLSTESDANWRFKNVRRQVFYFYPNGAAPLTGLMSLMNDEDTDDPEYSWWEKRLDLQRTITKQSAAGNGPFLANPATDITDGATTDAAAQTWVVGSIRAVRVDSTASLRIGHVIRIRNVTLSSGTIDLFGVITLIDTPDLKINVRSLTTTGAATVTEAGATTNVGNEVLIVGSAFSQGATALTPDNASPYNIPLQFTNFAQIFRTPFEITGTALKTAVKYDDTGAYKDQAKEASVYHMIEMEKAFLFGTKAQLTSATGGALITPGGTVSTIRNTTGGVLHHLARWEAGDYGTVTAAADADDDKRIIVNSGGTINEKTFNTYLERVFRVTNNTANEKLVLCGSGFLSVVNQLYKDKSTLTADLPLTDTYGMNVVKHTCPFGTLYYKTHPLFSQNPVLRYNAMILDIQNIKYRYMQGRDTELLKNRQNNGDDFRRDEWLTEGGLELRFPESCMYLQNVTGYTP